MQPEMDIRTIKIKLALTAVQLEAVVATAELARPVFDLFVKLANKHRSVSYMALHKYGYQEAKLLAPELPTGLLQTTAKRACACVRAWNTRYPKRRWEYAGVIGKVTALQFDKCTFSRRGDLTTFSSCRGRVRVLHAIPEWFVERYPKAKPQAAQVKVYADTSAVLHIQYRIASTALRETGSVVGVDRGLYNLYMTSTGDKLSSKRHIAVKRRYQHNRKTLQQKGTRRARLRLRAMRGREMRFMRDVNHCATKRLVSDVTVKTYVLEELTGIRSRRGSRKLNGWLSNWSFHEFETQLKYKCALAGIELVKVDPRYTSQKCSVCGVVNKDSRCRGRFCCVSCGYTNHADVNAACNIRDNYARSLKSGQGAFNRPCGDKPDVIRHAVRYDVVGPSIPRPCAGGC